MKATRVPDFEALADAGPGAYWLTVEDHPSGTRRVLYWRCPACGEIGSIHFGPDGWTLTGSDDAPTVTPSILKTGATCRWHGFLTAGEWVTA